MATIKKYVEPCITIVEVRNSGILCSSNSTEHICSKYCRLWHICQDRAEGKYCSDKIYS